MSVHHVLSVGRVFSAGRCMVSKLFMYLVFYVIFIFDLALCVGVMLS